MKNILNAILCAGILIGAICGFVGLGLWVQAGSRIALAIAIIFIWTLATVMFYFNREN